MENNKTPTESLALLEAIASDHPALLPFTVNALLASREQGRLQSIAHQWGIEVHQLVEFVATTVQQLNELEPTSSISAV